MTPTTGAAYSRMTSRQSLCFVTQVGGPAAQAIHLWLTQAALDLLPILSRARGLIQLMLQLAELSADGILMISSHADKGKRTALFPTIVQLP